MSRPEPLDARAQRVTDRLRRAGHVLVALSGGVDSTLLAKLARDALGKENAPAITADSPSLARRELADCVRLADQLDLRHVIVRTSELDDPEYRRNAPSRCFFCKQELFLVMRRLADARGIRTILYGAIGDDAAAERPGQQAAALQGATAPLQEAGFSKREVRELARSLGLPNWNKPQNACLASRVPHGSDVTAAKLAQIEAAEAFLKSEGFEQVRVRHHGRHARIEVSLGEVSRLLHPDIETAVCRYFTELGFESIGVDQAGYRPGGATQAAGHEVLLKMFCKAA
jgi:uncharacterized protein